MKKTTAEVPQIPADLPHFQSEEEEQKWYEEHPDFFEKLFRQAATEGRLKKTIKTGAQRLARAHQLQEAVSRANSVNITIRFPAFEIERAKRLAARKGLRYQTYIKSLLHDALEREEAQARP